MERKRKNNSINSRSDNDPSDWSDRMSRSGASHKVQQVITPYDYEQLKKHYKFVLESDDKYSSQTKRAESWQDRMVQNYHSQLYKTHVIADFSKFDTSSSPIGLRWRTEAEVTSGKGVETCGNRYCPSYFTDDDGGTKVKNKVEDIIQWTKTLQTQRILSEYHHSSSLSSMNYDTKESSGNASVGLKDHEQQLLDKVPFGIGLDDYQVHFAYHEHGEDREELVKLKLCLRCAPILFRFKGGVVGAKKARLDSLQNKATSKS